MVHNKANELVLIFLRRVAEGHDPQVVARNVLSTLEQKPSKFKLLADLGDIIVPETFEQTLYWSCFRMGFGKGAHSFDSDITDEHFPSPSRMLRAGEKFHVRAFARDVAYRTSVDEREGFFIDQKAVFLGGQGLGLVLEQKYASLPKPQTYISPDTKEGLWIDKHNRHRIPYAGVGERSVTDFHIALGNIHDPHLDDLALLIFTKVNQ